MKPTLHRYGDIIIDTNELVLLFGNNLVLKSGNDLKVYRISDSDADAVRAAFKPKTPLQNP